MSYQRLDTVRAAQPSPIPADWPYCVDCGEQVRPESVFPDGIGHMTARRGEFSRDCAGPVVGPYVETVADRLDCEPYE